ncbi:conjugal transfer protein [Salicibibacter cibarius]|uniref:Conjugal transfer protein n=1 Tax=Salicibibacter cibarius TaxID=2743000 RepID=A0A7T6Z2A5_9BACI|nr:conjugal transfer protein [Salicibibacter cibarius]QQK75396.1 conjugal transfer protein [Salicibibacter cibarius]
MKASFKHVWERMKRRKANIHRPPKEKSSLKKDTSRRTAIAVWTLIGGLLFFSMLAVMLSMNTRSTFNDLRAAVVDDDHEQEEEDSDMDVVTADAFLSDFVEAYINVRDDSEALDERRGALEPFMASMEADDEWDMYDVDMDGERRLEHANLFHVDETDDGGVFQYEVTYINEYDDESEEKTLLLHVPLAETDGQYAVTGEPYFTQVYDLDASITLADEERNMDAYVGDEQGAILAFLDDFFEEYASGDEDDLNYMMSDPESLNGAFVYEGMANETLEQQEDGFLVHTEVQMVEEVTGLAYAFDVALYLEEMNGNYMVTQMDYE